MAVDSAQASFKLSLANCLPQGCLSVIEMAMKESYSKTSHIKPEIIFRLFYP